MAQANNPQNNFPNLQGYRLDQLIIATIDNQHAIIWTRQHGVVSIQMVCDSLHCQGQNRQMREVSDSKRVDGVRWKCTKKECRKEYSIRKGSFFESSHLTICQILQLIIAFP